MATWAKIDRPLENGVIVPMQAPVIVSASRSTDIPAFYAEWFFYRLKIGYSAWTNPFNGVKSYVSYENTRFIVFWSKNPEPMIPYLHILKERNIKCYIQYTLNDYENERLEKVPTLSERIHIFKTLVKQLGLGAVVWRFDPMILTDDISVDDLLRKVKNIGDQLKDYTEKLVFSFADIQSYRKVKANLEKSGIRYHEWTEEEMNVFSSKLSELNKNQGWNFHLATCGEKIDISRYGILHNRCIDGDLITRIAWQDKTLMDFMKVKIESIPAPTLFGDQQLPEGAILLPQNHYFISKHKKDPGQRQFCDCMVSKDIGEYNTCPHLCEYCYANNSAKVVLRNHENFLKNKYAESITNNNLSN